MEATDADNLLEQFEEAAAEATEDFEETEEDPLEATESKTSNPKKTSNIFKAVQNHFAASAAASTSNGGKDIPTRRLPRIGKPKIPSNNSSKCISANFV